MYIASQALAIFALVFNVSSRAFKQQYKTLLFNFIANLINIVSCIFLTAYMGMAGLIVATLRSLVFFLYTKKNWDKQLGLLIVFIGLQIIACAVTVLLNGFVWWDLVLVFVKTTFYGYGSWQRNVKVFWACSIIACALTIVYFILHAGYVNAAAEAISIIIIIIVMIRAYRSEKNNEKSEAKDDKSKTNTEIIK